VSEPLIALVGPTASGKSALAVEIAHALGDTEIVSADAMQLYRGMDIGTAKITEPETQGLTHHLLSVVEPSEEVSVIRYRELFDSALKAISSKSMRALAVGGSTLYLAAALDEMQFAPTDPEVRERLERELEALGVLAMHEKLQLLDPVAAAKIPASNPRRVIRALEVMKISGESFSASLPEPSYRRPTLQLGLAIDREVLLGRVADRVRGMWDAGFLEEVTTLYDSGPLSRTAAVAIGYAQAKAQLDGELTEEAAIAETIQLTMRYAKKQMTWFRRDKRIIWLDSADSLSAALTQIRLVR
jgi:tRNA dimethylallyltransferase